MTFVCEAGFIRQHPGNHAGYTVDKNESGQFPAGQHIIPDRNLLVHKGVKNPFVPPLLLAAQNAYSRQLCQLNRPRLGQNGALRGHIDKMGTGARLFTNRTEAVGNGLGVHHHSHPPSIWSVVNLLLLVFCIIPYLVCVDFQNTLFLCPPDNAFVQKGVAHFGEERHQVYSHHQTTL